MTEETAEKLRRMREARQRAGSSSVRRTASMKPKRIKDAEDDSPGANKRFVLILVAVFVVLMGAWVAFLSLTAPAPERAIGEVEAQGWLGEQEALDAEKKAAEEAEAALHENVKVDARKFGLSEEKVSFVKDAYSTWTGAAPKTGGGAEYLRVDADGLVTLVNPASGTVAYAKLGERYNAAGFWLEFIDGGYRAQDKAAGLAVNWKPSGRYSLLYDAPTRTLTLDTIGSDGELLDARLFSRLDEGEFEDMLASVDEMAKVASEPAKDKK